MTDVTKLLSLEKRDFSPADRAMFTNDFKRLADEYFECEGTPEIDVTRTEDGYSVCVIFAAARIKQVKQIV